MGSGAARPRVAHVITDDARRGAQMVGASLDAALNERGWPSRLVALSRAPEHHKARLAVDVLTEGDSRVLSAARLRSAVAGADVVVAHGSTTLTACVVALPTTTPFVYVNIGDLRTWLGTWSRRTRMRFLLRRAARIASISSRSRDYMVRDLGIRPDKITVVPNYRDPATYGEGRLSDRIALRRSLGWDLDRPVALYLGSLTSEKRPDVAIDVARLLPHVQVVMAGPGRLSPQQEHAARRHGVHVVGAVDDPATAIAAADVVLLTSDTEGLPGVLIEAGMTGRPVASTDVGFVDEIVVDGETGRLAPAGDAAGLAAAVEDCLANGHGWGDAARQRCLARFSTDVVVPQWEQLLLSVAGHADASPPREPGWVGSLDA